MNVRRIGVILNCDDTSSSLPLTEKLAAEYMLKKSGRTKVEVSNLFTLVEYGDLLQRYVDAERQWANGPIELNLVRGYCR